MIYFTADLHLGHANIIKMRSRPFANAEEMDEKLIRNINITCNQNDTLVILGDVAFKGNKEKAQKQIARMLPKKVLIRGNHDADYSGGLFEAVHSYYDFKAYGRQIVLCHYPFLEWDGFFRGSLHLHGHQHNFADYNARMRKLSVMRYDVGVDANNYKPVSLDDIFDFFGLQKDNSKMLQNISFLNAK